MKQLYKCKEHLLIGNYSLVEIRMVIPYDTIEGKNIVTDNLSCLSLFMLLYIKTTTKKSFNTYFRLYKPVRMTAHTNRKFNNKCMTKHAFYFYSHFRTFHQSKCFGALIDNRADAPICVLEDK